MKGRGCDFSSITYEDLAPRICSVSKALVSSEMNVAAIKSS